MNKGLEALGKITGTQNLTMYEQDVCLKTIEKELILCEALRHFAEIIIGKDTTLRKDFINTEYENVADEMKKFVSKEDFEAIKEMLKNG